MIVPDNFDYLLNVIMRQDKSFYTLLTMLLMALAMVSCKETNDDVEEFPNWKNANTAFFTAKYNAARQAIANGDKSWFILKNYAKDATDTGNPTDYIVVKVINEGTGSGCPLFTDSVRVHYRGQLMASTSYVDSTDPELGLVFDKSWSGTSFDASTFVPAKFSVANTVVGFSTALQHMHIGDRWKVYIPYNLGYGEDDSGSIPAYSTLVFDLSLAAYYRAGTSLPAWN